jgi:hypothetical protein
MCGSDRRSIRNFGDNTPTTVVVPSGWYCMVSQACISPRFLPVLPIDHCWYLNLRALCTVASILHCASKAIETALQLSMSSSFSTTSLKTRHRNASHHIAAIKSIGVPRIEAALSRACNLFVVSWAPQHLSLLCDFDNSLRSHHGS